MRKIMRLTLAACTAATIVAACKSRNSSSAAKEAESPQVVFGISTSFFVGQTLPEDTEYLRSTASQGRMANVLGGLSHGLQALGDSQKKLQVPADLVASEFGRQLNYGVSAKTELSLDALVDNLADQTYDLAIVQGSDIAYMTQRNPKVKVLAYSGEEPDLSVSSMLIVNAQSTVTGIGDLKGQTIGLGKPRYYTVMALRQAITAVGGNPSGYFALPADDYTNLEDALDDLVDDKISAVAIDGGAWARYQQRKPARAAKLKTIANYGPFTPPAIVYIDGNVTDDAINYFTAQLCDQPFKGMGTGTIFEIYPSFRRPAVDQAESAPSANTMRGETVPLSFRAVQLFKNAP